MINPLSQIPNTGNFENHPRLPINDKIANNMPNGLLRIPNIDNSKNMNNHNVVNHYPKQIFNAHLSPSIGSLTENFVKSKTLFSNMSPSELPLPTKIMLGLGDFLSQYVIITVFGLITILLRSPNKHGNVDRSFSETVGDFRHSSNDKYLRDLYVSSATIRNIHYQSQ